MNKIQTGIAVALSLIVVAIFFVFSSQSMAGSFSVASTAAPTQLLTQDEILGTGPEAKVGDHLTVSYTGRFENGTVFDTSVGKAAPQGCSGGYCFLLGAGKVIPGWDQGLIGMKVGGKRLLVVPPDLAYGASDYGSIPANSTLIFEVTLLALKPGNPVQQ
jgi:peptidylprolyl isomerase